MGGFFGERLKRQGTLPLKEIKQARRSRVVLKSIGAPTNFEQKLFIKAGKKGEILFSSKNLGTFMPVIENNRIIGYYRASNGFYQLLDREGKRVWCDERGIEPSLISPIDIFGPGLITGTIRGIAFRLTVRGISRGITGGISAGMARALAAMRTIAKKILNTRVVVEIGAGDLKASLQYILNSIRKVRMIAVEPDFSLYAELGSRFRSLGGTVVKDTEEIMANIADEVFQYFPYRIHIGGEGMVTHAPHKIVSEALRITKPKAIIRYVTEHEETARYIVNEAVRLGSKKVSMSTTSNLAKAAPGASGAGVPAEAISRGVFYVVKIIKSTD